MPEHLRLQEPEGYMEDRDGEAPTPADRMEDVDAGNGRANVNNAPDRRISTRDRRRIDSFRPGRDQNVRNDREQDAQDVDGEDCDDPRCADGSWDRRFAVNKNKDKWG